MDCPPGYRPYQPEQLRAKLCHDLYTRDGRHHTGMYPNARSWGGGSTAHVHDDDVLYVRVSPPGTSKFADMLNNGRTDPYPMPTVKLNGQTVHLPATLTYEKVVKRAGLTGTPSVTFRDPTGLHGILSPGESIGATEGMVINAVHTGNA